MATDTATAMTVHDLTVELLRIPESKRHLPAHACNEHGDNFPIKSVSAYDRDAEISEDNPLGLDF